MEGNVAFITGAARGQGRSHAVALAERGVDIVAIDVCKDIPTVPYPLGTAEELDETVRLVEAEGRRAIAVHGDVRSGDDMRAATGAALDAFGRLDIVIGNAGVAQGFIDDDRPSEEVWADYIAINLTGMWNTIQATMQAVIDGGRGGSYILINSTSGLKGMSRGDPRSDAYTAAKHGLVGLMRAYATELGPHGIRVNCVHPTAVDTAMVTNDAMQAWIAHNVSRVATGFRNALDAPMLEPRDISEAVVWLASDAAKYITGVSLPVDAGFLII